MNQNSEPLPQNNYDPLNQCHNCGRRNGKYQNIVTQEVEGLFLIGDARGYKVCNFCAKLGHLMKPQKITKAEKKRLKKMKLEMMSFQMLSKQSITLDVHGNKVV